MTSDELQNYIATKNPLIETRPLWEIAYQLAVLNEQRMSTWTEAVLKENVQVLGSSVGADSNTEVRGDCSPHIWRDAFGGMFCAKCGIRAHERTTNPDPQAAAIQPKEKGL